MRILMLSWEYPPRSIGGLAQHVYDLTAAQSKLGADLHLITVGDKNAPEYEVIGGIKVYRIITYPVSSLDFTQWVPQMNIALMEKAIAVLNQIGNFHLIHNHDWLTAYAAVALKNAYKIPMVSTIHATEFGRNLGLHNELQRHISGVERWLSFESLKVICCSHHMNNEIKHVFQVPEDKLRIIYNGVNASNFVSHDKAYKREIFADPGEKIIFTVGRLVREKGFQVLLEAVPIILKYLPNTKFVIAGKGPYEKELKEQVSRMGIEDHVYFAGYIDDGLRNALYKWASVAVIPSLYEPFGIVALEAMAAQTPLVVSDTGGLSEIVNHGVDGLKAKPGDSNSLSGMIFQLLKNPGLADQMQKQAYLKVKREYSWQEIAKETREVYLEILGEK